MNRVVSREEWLQARIELLRREKELTRLRDELTAAPFDERDVEQQRAVYNFGTARPEGTEMPGFGCFWRADDGAVFHTCSTYGRGLDPMNPVYQMLDLVPLGRDEDALPFSMAWVRLRDEYGG